MAVGPRLIEGHSVQVRHTAGRQLQCETARTGHWTSDVDFWAQQKSWHMDCMVPSCTSGEYRDKWCMAIMGVLLLIGHQWRGSARAHQAIWPDLLAALYSTSLYQHAINIMVSIVQNTSNAHVSGLSRQKSKKSGTTSCKHSAQKISWSYWFSSTSDITITITQCSI